MSIQFPIALLAIFIGGIALATQGPINAALARAAGGPIWAAAISFGVGLALLAALAIWRGPAPAASSLLAAPWWTWVGGALGAFYVATAAATAPVLGALTLIAAVIFGQLVAGLTLDATGAFGLPVREVSLPRLGAVALVGAGLVLSRF